MPTALPVELEKLERKDPLKKVTEAPAAGAHSAYDNKSSIGKSQTLARLPSRGSIKSAASPLKKRGN